jgi:hypothetical protein
MLYRCSRKCFNAPVDDEAAETKGAGVAARQGASARGEERGIDLGDGVHIKNRGPS